VFIDLVEDLRCPRSHEETWLVVAAHRTDGRDIIDGTLGCPVCHTEYPIRQGVVWFDGEPHSAEAPAPQGDAEHAMRLAAFLDLSERRGFALLAGTFGPLAEMLRDIAPTYIIALNPAGSIAASGGISTLVISRGIPLADASCRAVALDAAHDDTAHMEAAVRVLLPRGRLVAPAATRLPPGVRELGRDEQLWVAERTAAPPKLVTLRGRGA
jgi:uncharacterized protein YbaR (Trm112 family)